MLRKIAKGFCCVALYFSQVYTWITIFNTWPLFNQVTNTTIVNILSLILATLSCYGFICIGKWAWKNNG